MDRQTVRTTCPYCGVGCGVLATPAGDGSVTIAGDGAHPANFGRLCSKGSALGETVDLAGRLLYPMIDGRQAGWDAALDRVAGAFRAAIRDHGPDSVAFYISGQLLTEDYYVANKLMKGFIGSANIDTNSRLCMASSVAGHRRAFGSDTVPGTYTDLEQADLVVLTGANLAWCHPVLHQRIAAAKQQRPDLTVVLIDPRRTATSDLADLHLAIAPDSDVPLFLGLLAWLDRHGEVDAAWVARHTNGFAAARDAAQTWTVTAVAAATGLPPHLVERFYRLWAQTEKTVTAYSQGVNQSACGTDKVSAILNCHLATARIGRPGMGPFSLTGQPNAMGGREVGGLANMLAAHLELEDAAHRALVQRFWQAPRIADKPGLKAVDLFQAVGDGRIKALWIMATNPVDSLPAADAVAAALAACPFVVVSDIMATTDTTAVADVLLPALGWGEKDGTVTNSERRISRQRAFLPPPGEARADWWHLAAVAQRMGFGEGFGWRDAAEIFAEHAALTACGNAGTRDLDLGAHATIDRATYDALAPFQWPQAAGQPQAETRFFANGGFFTADAKARFIPVAAVAPRPAAAGTLTLNTGRVRDHWHTLTRTGQSARLSAHIAEPFAEFHADDAAMIGLGDAEIAELHTAQGTIRVRALLTHRQQRGSVFVPMHWTGQVSSAGRVGILVEPVTDPISGQPASKHTCVRARRFPAHAYGFAVSRCQPDPSGLDYWALARTQGGWRIEWAHGAAIATDAARLCRLLGIACNAEAESLGYADPGRGDHRFAVFQDGRLAGAVFISPAPVAVSRGWAAGLLGDDFSRRQDRWRIVAGRPGADVADPGALVCACMQVGANTIAAAIARGCSTVGAVGQATGAGTQCGSCQSEIGAFFHDHHAVAAA